MAGRASLQAICDKPANRFHANLFPESLQILLLSGHVCTTEDCQKPHIIKRIFAPHVSLYIIMQMIKVIVRHYAQKNNDTYL
jgi:hypothetical protein